MPRRRYSLRDKLVTLAQAYTQKEIARQIGVSERTIRRWKNENVRPAEYLASVRQAETKLQRSFEREHKRVAAEARRDRRVHPEAPKLEKKLRVLPVGHRRDLKVYERGRDTGRSKKSDWINYDVRAWSFKEIHTLIAALRDAGKIVQLIYRIPKGARYPRDRRGRPGKVVTKSTRTGSPPLDLSNMDDGELQDFMLQYAEPQKGAKARRIMYVSALDQVKRSR